MYDNLVSLDKTEPGFMKQILNKSPAYVAVVAESLKSRLFVTQARSS